MGLVMGNLWDTPGVPHKGWRCVDSEDVRSDGQSVEDTSYETCEMCGQEQIRYVHLMEHDDYPVPLRVGCICAGKMTEDYGGTKRREARLRNRATRKTRWLRRKWKCSQKGNPYLNVQGHNLTVFRDRFKPGFWKYCIDRRRFSQSSHQSEQAAKLALFDEFCRIIEAEEDQRGRSGSPFPHDGLG